MKEIGATAGLGAAICWALASVLYVRVPIGAGAMTTFKNCLATMFLAVALWVSSVWNAKPMFEASLSAWIDIAVSGVIGLCLADIAYFRSIQILGPRQGITLTLLTPPTTALLGQWWLEDVIGLTTWSFILLTIFGIGLVMRERPATTADQLLRPGSVRWGVTCALLGIVAMAIGAVVLKRGTQHVGSIEGTFIRLMAASVFGIVISTILKQFPEIWRLMKNPRGTLYLCSATILGTVVGVYLMLVAYKYCSSAGIAATLTSTTPLFVIPVVYVVYQQRISIAAIFGAGVAFAGVCGLLLR